MKDVIQKVQSIWDKIWEKIQGLLEKAGVKTMSDADLMAILEAEAVGKNLNWKSSVVDFLKLLDIDSSAENRAALAKELNVSNEFMPGTAQGNEALRVAVWRRIAENGGKVPSDLTD